MIKKLLIFTCCFLLFSCGFQIIYRENESDKISYEKELATIRIQKDRGSLSQELRNSLKDIFNPDYLPSEPKYILTLEIKKEISGSFITITGASGRNKVNITVNYQLKELSTGKTVARGYSIVNDNYDVKDNRYGTYVAEDYVSSNIIKTTAIEIRNSLVNDLIEIKKKKDKGLPIEIPPEEILDKVNII